MPEVDVSRLTQKVLDLDSRADVLFSKTDRAISYIRGQLSEIDKVGSKFSKHKHLELQILNFFPSINFLSDPKFIYI